MDATQSVQMDVDESVTSSRAQLFALLAVVAAPFAAAAIWRIFNHWDIQGVGDWAVIEMRTRTAFSAPILIGQVSRFNTHSFGPIWNYMSWPFYWLFGGRTVGMFVAAATINGALTVFSVWLAWRRLGRGPAVLLALVVLTMTLVVGPDVYADHWNPHQVLFAIPALFVIGWSISIGNDADLTWFAVMATIAAQAHLSGVMVSAFILGVAALSRIVVGPRRLPQWRTLLTSLAVATVLWIPPIIETFIDPPGNMARVLKFLVASDDRPSTLTDGLGVMIITFSSWPSWLSGRSDAEGVDSFAWVLGLLAFVAFAVLALAAYRRRRRELFFPFAYSFLLIPVVTFSVWRSIGELVPYTYLWTISAGAMASFGALVAVLRCFPEELNVGAWRVAIRTHSRTGLIVAAVAGVLLGAAVYSSASTPSRLVEPAARAAQVTAAVEAATTRDRPLVLAASRTELGEARTEQVLAVVLDAEKQGYDVATRGLDKWFDEFERELQPGDQVIIFSPSDTASPTGIVIYERDGLVAQLVDET